MRTTPPHRQSRRLAVLLAASLLMVVAACGGDDGEDDAAVDATEAPAPDATEAADDTEPDGGSTTSEGESDTTEDESDTTDDTGTDADPADAAAKGWDQDASQFRSEIGEQFVFDCPAGGGVGRLWGTDTYTDDSIVCVAAVHAGLITFEDGGSVVIEITEGEETYEGTTRNGVTSGDYGSWAGSFIFPTS